MVEHTSKDGAYYLLDCLSLLSSAESSPCKGHPTGGDASRPADKPEFSSPFSSQLKSSLWVAKLPQAGLRPGDGGLVEYVDCLIVPRSQMEA